MWVKSITFAILIACILPACQKALHFPPDDTTPTTTHSVKDIYVAGYESEGTNHIAKYWKNSAPVSLTDGTNDAYAWAVTVAGNDVYVAGMEKNHTGGKFIAKYWKNGVPVSLTDGSYDATATAIALSGNDVYVGGHVNSPTGNIVKYWKNGTATPLSVAGKEAQAFSIAVSGTDVYVTG